MEDSYEKEKRLYFIVDWHCSAVFCVTTSAQAAVRKNRFVKSIYGNVYYYNAQGKRVKGLVTIRGRKYYCDSRGVQRNS